MLAKGSRFGLAAAAAYTVTALVSAVPAALLPLVTVSKFGSAREATLFSGVDAFWHEGMRLLAVWVLICGGLATLALLAVLAAVLGSGRRPRPWREKLERWAHLLQQWAMPEVQVLAVLVGLVRLGRVVDITIGPGLWFYGAVSVLTLLAWRSFDFGVLAPRGRARASHA
jgi:paraquat-inducible protein A